MSNSLPSRVRNSHLAMQLYGPLAARIFAGLTEGDHLADAAVEAANERWIQHAIRAETPQGMPMALRVLVESMASPPSWVDDVRCDEGGRLLFRSHIAGGITLGAGSLLGGYTSPAGNKPLVFSGRLEDAAPFRLAETGRFVVETCRPGGLRPGAEGWGITLRVRLMHARVRQLLLGDSRWRSEDWGVPINQHDLVATTLLFSTVFVDGIRRFGVSVSPEEEGDYIHLWRTSGWLMGVREEHQPRDRYESDQLRTLIQMSQAPPDDDSRALTRALLYSPRLSVSGSMAERHIALGEGFARALLGDEVADALAIPRRTTRFLVPLIRAVTRILERLPSGWMRARSESYGHRYWQQNLEVGFGNREATYALPKQLRRKLNRGTGVGSQSVHR